MPQKHAYPFYFYDKTTGQSLRRKKEQMKFNNRCHVKRLLCTLVSAWLCVHIEQCMNPWCRTTVDRLQRRLCRTGLSMPFGTWLHQLGLATAYRKQACWNSCWLCSTMPSTIANEVEHMACRRLSCNANSPCLRELSRDLSNRTFRWHKIHSPPCASIRRPWRLAPSYQHEYGMGQSNDRSDFLYSWLGTFYHRFQLRTIPWPPEWQPRCRIA